MRALPLGYITACQAGQREVKMVEIIEALRHEHRNIEKLLQVLEQELSVFDHGDRPDYEVILAVIDYFRDYPGTCPAATIGDLEFEHREGARRLRRVAEAVEARPE